MVPSVELKEYKDGVHIYYLTVQLASNCGRPAGNGTLGLPVASPTVQSMEVSCWPKKWVKNVEEFLYPKNSCEGFFRKVASKTHS